MLRILITLVFFLIGPLGLGTSLPDSAYGAAMAQSNESAGPDYDAWQRVAARAETALTERRASDAAIDLLRLEMVGWREVFDAAQVVNQDRLDTLRSQLQSLGQVPEDGTETASVAERRATLAAQIAELQAPQLVAEEAYNHAVGLIRESDNLLRERQTNTLLSRGASPLVPELWSSASRSLANFFALVRSEVVEPYEQQSSKRPSGAEIAFAIALVVVAVALFIRSGRWVDLAFRFVRPAGPPTAQRLLGFLRQALKVGALALAALIVREAIYAANMAGFRGQLVVDSLFYVFLLVIGARWLASLVLDVDAVSGAPKIPEDQVGPARSYAGWIGLAYGAMWLLAQIASFEDFEGDVHDILQFPVLILAGLLLIGLGGKLRLHVPSDLDEDGQAIIRFQDRIASWLGNLSVAVGVIGPVAALLGYHLVGRELVMSWAETLAVLSVVGAASGVLRDLFGFVTGRDDEALGRALIPVLVSALLVVAALPVLALVWGMRSAELQDLWSGFLSGFSIGDLTISPAAFVTFAIVFAIGYLATKAIQSSLRNSVLPRTKIEAGAQVAIVSGAGYVGVFLAALIAISTAGIDLSSLAIVAGALSVGIGFGLQNIVSNFVSGIILLIERPIAEGDWIEAGGYMGTVKEISVRSTRIETFDRSDVIVPNADLVSGAVVNYTRGNKLGRIILPVGVAYGSDTRKVQEILEEIINAHPAVHKRHGASVHFIGFGADSLDFDIRAILKDINEGLGVRTELRHQIAARFAEEGIEIPFAQRDVWIRNPEDLPGNATRKRGGGKP